MLIRNTKVGLAAAKEPKLAVISYFRTSESIHIEFYNCFFNDDIPYWHHYNPLLNTNYSLILDWASMGTISAREPMAGYPFTNPWDISDGTSSEVSTGIPYMYFTDMEMSVIDLKVSKQVRRKVFKFYGWGSSNDTRPFKQEGFASVKY